jgi:ABC-type sugar transport system ATPase subunit
VIARALQIGPKIILMDEPTRGVDVGAKYEIYEILFRLASEGCAVLLVSSDLMELMALADRMIVLNKGSFRGELIKSEYSQTEIMSRALSSSQIET